MCFDSQFKTKIYENRLHFLREYAKYHILDSYTSFFLVFIILLLAILTKKQILNWRFNGVSIEHNFFTYLPFFWN